MLVASTKHPLSHPSAFPSLGCPLRQLPLCLSPEALWNPVQSHWPRMCPIWFNLPKSFPHRVPVTPLLVKLDEFVLLHVSCNNSVSKKVVPDYVIFKVCQFLHLAHCKLMKIAATLGEIINVQCLLQWHNVRNTLRQAIYHISILSKFIAFSCIHSCFYRSWFVLAK